MRTGVRALLLLAAFAAGAAGCTKAAAPVAGPGATTGTGAATTTAPATTAPPTTTAPGLVGGNDYCSVVIAENTKWGTLRNGKFISFEEATPAQLKGLLGDALANRAQFIALTPPEIRGA